MASRAHTRACVLLAACCSLLAAVSCLCIAHATAVGCTLQAGSVIMSCDQLEGIVPFHENWGVNLGEEVRTCTASHGQGSILAH